MGFRAVNTVNSMEIKRYKNSRTFLGAGKKVSIRKPNDSPNVHKKAFAVHVTSIKMEIRLF